MMTVGGSSNGGTWQVPAQPTPPTIWEESAVEWHRAREALQSARANHEAACNALREAENREAKAWSNLENVAERGPQVARAMPVGNR